MNYSFEPKSRYKEYEYYRYSYFRGKTFKEKVYCKNDIAFLEFLNEMNNKNRHSKYSSKDDWSELEKIQQFIDNKPRSKEERMWLSWEW